MSSTAVWTRYEESSGLLRTRVHSVLSSEDVARWEEELDVATRALPASATFRMLVDIRGYEVSEQDPSVHRRQRLVVPTFLARRGMEVGFFRLFEVENTIAAEPDLARCTAVAHVHHDANKLQLYNERLRTEREAFFTDPAEAEAWLRGAGPGDG